MAERNFENRRITRRTPPPPPPPRRRDVPPARDDEIYAQVRRPSWNSEPLYENISPLRFFGGSFSEFDNDTNTDTARQINDMYVTPIEDQEGMYQYGRFRENQNAEEVYDIPGRASNDTETKTDRFKRNPSEFVDEFNLTRDEMRTKEETYIIVDLLKKNESNVPILDGDLEQLALLACCSSPHVVKRALDALLNEIFLSISDFWAIRCRKILKAEEILRLSFQKFLSVEHLKAKCQRMTTYAWLTTLVLLKCGKEECGKIAPEMKRFDRTLEALLRDPENREENTFRYGIVLARESIKQIDLLCGRRDEKKSLQRCIEKCAQILNSRLEKREVTSFGRELENEESWLNLHLCLVYLQDLPKLHQFQGNLKPIILIQMLIQNRRERCSRRNNSSSKLKSALKMQSIPETWRLEILVYHVMRRLIRTSKDDVIVEQVLMGNQGCGGIFSSWIENKSTPTKDSLAMENLGRLCERVVFRAPPICFEQLITYNCKGNEQDFIENLSILRVTSIYKDKVLEILPKPDVRYEKKHVSTYDALMNGRSCVLKVYRHSKEEIKQRVNTPKAFLLQKEIEIVTVLNALAEPCPNVVQLFGSSIEAPMHMIIEGGSKGDLLTFLKRHLIKSTETQRLVQIAMDICNAMIFLGNQNMFHRDLRAKNCFVIMQDGKLLTKLGGFHVTVLAYSGPRSPTSVKKRRPSIKSTINQDFFNQFAVRWMAAETLKHGEFSTASDVWSFGVLLFEIFTFGSEPYVNMPNGLSLNSDEKVREYVINGNRLELHPRIPESIQNLIQSTMVDADSRPTFSELKDNFLGTTFEDEIYVDVSHFKISHDYESVPPDVISQSIGASTGCTVKGCSGECLNASDIAVPLKVGGGHFIREFLPESSCDIPQLPGTECASLATVTHNILHDGKLELRTAVGDMGSLKYFINKYGCSMGNAMRYLLQIGEAVSFLHAMTFIHRNLRADSAFIYSNGNAKLACLARVRRLMPNADDQSSAIPINLPMPEDSLRWSSPEVITDGEYSKASDMWAFGVLIWETFTLIDKDLEEVSDEEVTPYHQLTTKDEILSYLQRNQRLGQPKSCPDWLYELMLSCWKHNAQDRVTAQDIVQCINTNEQISE